MPDVSQSIHSLVETGEQKSNDNFRLTSVSLCPNTVGKARADLRSWAKTKLKVEKSPDPVVGVPAVQPTTGSSRVGVTSKDEVVAPKIESAHAREVQKKTDTGRSHDLEVLKEDDDPGLATNDNFFPSF